MKILATSDIHGNKSIIDKLTRAYEDSCAELLLICGDIGGKGYHISSLNEFSLHQLQDYNYLIDKLKKCSKPFKCILGNDDWFDAEDEFCLTIGQKFNSITAFDLVHITPYDTNREANENKLAYELSRIKIDSESVIIAHGPPYGAQDKIYSGERVGSKAVKKYIEDNMPKIWLCGHIHEDYGVSRIGETLVVNCACDHLRDKLQGFIVNTDSLEYEAIKI
jgi:Icc-related predicted phosphoesterase